MTNLSTYQIETGILTALDTIAECWPETLGTRSPGSISRYCTDKSAESKMPLAEAVLDVRAQARACLNGWCRVVMEDRDVLGPLKDDPRDMARWLRIHARWMSGHEAGPVMMEELQDQAAEVRRVARPQRRDWTWIGDCPVTMADCGEVIVCGAPIRVWPEKPIRCANCGTEDTLDGWILRLVGTNGLVTSDQLVPILRRRMGIAVTKAAIRQWVKRGVIHSSGVDEQGRAVFDRVAVFTALAKRERSA